jgi:hypothetical protein
MILGSNKYWSGTLPDTNVRYPVSQEFNPGSDIYTFHHRLPSLGPCLPSRQVGIRYGSSFPPKVSELHRGIYLRVYWGELVSVMYQ